MPQVHSIGQPQNDAEREVIRRLRDGLPSDYHILHNFDLPHQKQFYEVDVAVIAPHAIYLVDVKGTQGTIFWGQGKWHPEGREPFASPVRKIREHAKWLKDLLFGPRSDVPWIEAVVLLTAPDAVFVDPGDNDKACVQVLDGCERFFTNPTRLNTDRDTGRLVRTSGHLGAIMETLLGKARPMKGLPLLQSWKCVEKISVAEGYTDYRARNAHFAGGEIRRARVYRLDPYLPEIEQQRERKRIEIATQVLAQLPAHPVIPAFRDAFATQDNDGWVLLTDDLPAESLRRRLDQPRAPLTMEQKMRIARLLLDGLSHCHSNGVAHRAVSPSTVLLSDSGQVRLTDFELAKPVAQSREVTVVEEITKRQVECYLAPEVYGDPTQALPPADVYSAGVTIFEMLKGTRPWENLEEAFACQFTPAEPLSATLSNLPTGFDAWLQRLIVELPAKRSTASVALTELLALLQPPAVPSESASPPLPVHGPEPKPALDYDNLPAGALVEGKFCVEKRLGDGSFSVAYKVIDTFGDLPRALKIITRDRQSVIARMKQEYHTLVRVPDHPHVVKLIDGNVIQPGGFPYLVFDFIEGSDVRALIDGKRLSLPEAVALAVQVADGLTHLHAHRVTHGDIKPSNLLWGENGVKILDFNVAVLASYPQARTGGSRKYLPPDFDPSIESNEAERQDRDVYALGLTLYEAVTGQYPWVGEKEPPQGKLPRDPRDLSGFVDLSPKLVETMLRAIAPRRGDRFGGARDMAEALKAVQAAGLRVQRIGPVAVPAPSALDAEARPNANPFVDYLLTLFSQSRRTNAGTRGLDDLGRQLYIETELDRSLRPAVLGGEFGLVLITGNAGDGKTAFIQQVEAAAVALGASPLAQPSGNGSVWKISGRTFLSNYDGSQDEGEKVNDSVLLEFFAPFQGKTATSWPKGETRLIAINEGRLVDFFEKHGAHFGRLRRILAHGLKTGVPQDGVAVVNLNLRSVVATTGATESILDRLLLRMVDPQFWDVCQQCDLRDRCYVRHNVRTFQDPTAGAQVRERLRKLYTLTVLRSRLHLTLRDLRSALAYTLAGTRSCEEIHALYLDGRAEPILRGFYFHSWNGAGVPEQDRLLRLLREIDVGMRGDPRLDRGFDFRTPEKQTSLMDFEKRGGYDRELLALLHRQLPRDPSKDELSKRVVAHRAYVGHLRRLYTFETRDESWKTFLPYRSAGAMLDLLREPEKAVAATSRIVRAINRGEGIADPNRLKGKLALQVRQVDGGTMRSYRVFPAERFKLEVQVPAELSPYLEHAPHALILRYADPTGLHAELLINLDVFEMLERLNEGYRPTVEEVQGYYLSLNVFKNVLSAAPYQEVLLTATGHEFFSIERRAQGELAMTVAETGGSHAS